MKPLLHFNLQPLAALLALAFPAAAFSQAVTAVAAEGAEPTAMISGVAARAPFLLFFDTQGNLAEAVANPYRAAGGSAGKQVADFIAAKGATVFIAGEFGGKLVTALKGHAISHQIASGPAIDAVKPKATAAPEVLTGADALLARVDRNLQPESAEMYRKLINIEPDGTRKEFVLYSLRKGRDRMVVLFLSPASEKGRATLRQDENMWLNIPEVGRPIRITSLQSVVGGVFNNSDILRLDYHAEYDAVSMVDEGATYRLELKAKSAAIAYDNLIMIVDKEAMVPTTIECRTADGMLIKTLRYSEPKDFGDGIQRPSVLETDSPLYQGYRSVMVWARITPRELPDEIFTLNHLPRVSVLR